jgi:hypothetical protein
MTFDDAAKLDPDSQAGELHGGRWVPVTRNTWRHGQLAGNVYVLLRAYAKANPGWSVSIGDPGTKLGHDDKREKDLLGLLNNLYALLIPAAEIDIAIGIKDDPHDQREGSTWSWSWIASSNTRSSFQLPMSVSRSW